MPRPVRDGGGLTAEDCNSNGYLRCDRQQTNEWTAAAQVERIRERLSWARTRSKQRGADGCVLCSLPQKVNSAPTKPTGAAGGRFRKTAPVR